MEGEGLHLIMDKMEVYKVTGMFFQCSQHADNFKNIIELSGRQKHNLLFNLKVKNDTQILTFDRLNNHK